MQSDKKNSKQQKQSAALQAQNLPNKSSNLIDLEEISPPVDGGIKGSAG